ncbi:MAG: hypothetical protein MUC96_30575 [Myxococcaceae bacterium]|nr:hypothetical protein [Myxococcaceae bacterium]
MARGALELAAQAEPDAGVGLRWQVTVRDVRAQVTPAQPNAVYRQQVRITRLGPAALADEGWHRLTMLVQRETSLGAGNGVLRVWIDGDAVLDYDGDGSGPWRGQVFTGTAPFGSIAFPTTLVTGASQAQSRWFDEVVLFEPLAGAGLAPGRGRREEGAPKPRVTAGRARTSGARRPPRPLSPLKGAGLRRRDHPQGHHAAVVDDAREQNVPRHTTRLGCSVARGDVASPRWLSAEGRPRLEGGVNKVTKSVTQVTSPG